MATIERGGPPVPAAAVEHVRLLRAVREHQRGRRRRPSSTVELTDLDRWALSRLQETVAVVRERLDDFDATVSGREIQRFVDDLSNWYVRRSRRRFWDGDPGGVRDPAPLPGDGLASCWRRSARSSPTRSTTTSTARSRASTCATSRPPTERDRRARAGDGDRPRDRPARARRPRAGEAQGAPAAAGGRDRRDRARARRDRAAGRDRRATSSTSASCGSCREADELGEVEIKPNYRTLGPRFGKQMPMVAAAVAGLDPARVAAALRDGEHGRDRRRRHRAPLERRRPADHHEAARGLPGRARGLARGRARARDRRLAAGRGPRRARSSTRSSSAAQDAGLEVSDRITLILDGDAELLDAVRAHHEYVARRDARARDQLRRPRRRRAGDDRRPAVEDRHRARLSCAHDRAQAAAIVRALALLTWALRLRPLAGCGGSSSAATAHGDRAGRGHQRRRSRRRPPARTPTWARSPATSGPAPWTAPMPTGPSRDCSRASASGEAATWIGAEAPGPRRGCAVRSGGRQRGQH